MRNTGLRNPRRNALICFAMFVGGTVSVLSGVSEMTALGRETTSSAAQIGIGLFVGIIGFVFQFNFLWGMRVVRAMRRGDDEIARWTLSPDALAAFRKNEETREGAGRLNDYNVPARAPAGGLEVVFNNNGALVGDTYFGLSTTGLSHFRSARLVAEEPPYIEFETALVWASNVTVPRVRVSRGALRIPVSPSATAQARKVVARYNDILSRKIIVKPDFWRWRMRIGLITAIVCALIAAAGFGFEAVELDLGFVPLIMAVAGTIFALAGLILAAIAWKLHREQHRGSPGA